MYAWGRIIATTGTNAAVVLNPLRYRGYIYDNETNLYYLQSRYYDPTTGRFLNADDINYLGATGTVLSCNLFAYCENDGVNNSDISGYFGTPIQWACAIIGGIAGVLFGDYFARSIGLFPGQWWQWQTYAYWTVRALVIAGGAVL